MKPSSNDKRSFHRVMTEVNTTLAAIHKKLPTKITTARYATATDYVSQYISYTTIWNVKFVYNLESPEVALMQIFHLDYIFSQESENEFKKERGILQQMKQLFLAYSPYPEETVARRKRNFLQHIENTMQ